MIEIIRARHRLSYFIWLVVVGAFLVLGNQPAGAVARPLVTGISTVENDSVALQHVHDVGANLILRPINWAAVAPEQRPQQWQPVDPADPHYDWTEVDAGIAQAVAAGLSPIAQIYGAPQWAQRCRAAGVPPEVPCDPDPTMLTDFAKAAARRYSGQILGLPRVRYWQGLNEPNLSLFFNPQFRGGKPVSPALYRRLINAFYFGIKSVNKSNLVLAAGLGPIARPRSTIGPMRFTRELLCMRDRRNPRPVPGGCHGGVHFDIFDIHPYTTGGPTHKGHVDDVQLGDLGKLQELIDAADAAGRIKGRFRHTPLWMTEFSWDSKPPDPGGVPMRILKRWTADALYRAWDAGVSRFFWLVIRDNAPNPRLPFSETIEAGLYFRGATVAEDLPKPNMYAFRFPFVAYSRESGFFFWGRTPDSGGGAVLIQIRKGSGWRNVAVARANQYGIFEGEVEGAYGRNKRGTVRARYRKELAVPFSLKPVKGFHQPPFG